MRNNELWYLTEGTPLWTRWPVRMCDVSDRTVVASRDGTVVSMICPGHTFFLPFQSQHTDTHAHTHIYFSRARHVTDNAVASASLLRFNVSSGQLLGNHSWTRLFRAGTIERACITTGAVASGGGLTTDRRPMQMPSS